MSDPDRRFTNRTTDSKRDKRYAGKGSRPRPDREKEEELAKLLPIVFSKIPDEPKDFHTHPTEAKLWARAAWWSGKYSVNEISEAINLKEATIYTWIRGNSRVKGWADEKDEADKKALKKELRNNSIRMKTLMEQMLTVLEKTVVGIIDENRRLSVDEFTKVTNAFEKIFKLRQLELGKPTEIFAGEDGKLPTWTEIRERMKEVDVPEYEVLEAEVNGTE